jgi:hypothetical protein
VSPSKIVIARRTSSALDAPPFGLLRAQQSEMSGHLMARKSSSRLKPMPRRKPTAHALLVKARTIRDPSHETDLTGLAEQRVVLEALLVELASVQDELDAASKSARPSRADRSMRTQLRRAESDVTKTLVRIEDRIARAPVSSVEYAILKLRIYGTLQGYDFGTPRPRRNVVSADQRLFFSILDGLERLTRPDRDARRQQSSDRKRSIKARK